MNKVDKNYDITVVGAGMIGAATAIGLAKEGWRVLLLDDIKPLPFDSKSQPDLRVSSLSCHSVNLLKQLGVWNTVLGMRLASYKRLEIWEQENSHVIFEANTLGLPSLGYIVENRILQLALWQKFSYHPNLTLLCPAKLIAMQRCHRQWKISLNNKQEFLTNLIIAADGLHSQVRSLVGIGTNGWEYDQLCLLITVKMKQPEQNITWQQFFPSGPRAFLPLFNHWACLVWYDKPARIKQLQAMSLEKLKQEVILAFPARIGQLEVIAKGSFPLNHHHANRYVDEGVALIGDAAHSINPLAGQGVNLGYRDIDSLLKVLINAKACLLPFYTRKTLLAYQRDRMQDNKLMQLGVDIIYFLFTSHLTVLRDARNLILILVQQINSVKRKVLKYALGL